MDNLRYVLKEQCEKYPRMEISDFLKLIYQNEMAGGHMIKDKPSALSFLEEEAAEVSPAFKSCDNLGNDMARVYLCDIMARKIPLPYLLEAFIFTANRHKGNLDLLKEKLSIFYDMVKEKELPLDIEEVTEALKAYREKGFPAIHHSEAFRKNYAPHYRVVYRKFAEILPVLERAVELKKEKRRVTIVIDGRCGSGKSTCADYIAEVLKCPVIRADDFFLPPEKRTAERLSQAGGNINYEYFKETVADAVKENRIVKYRPFDCHAMAFREEISFPESDFLVVEGSYSHHPYFGSYGDIRVFSDIAPDFQKERIEERNGDFAVNFFTRWIPMEEKYFSAYNIKEKAEIIIKAER